MTEGSLISACIDCYHNEIFVIYEVCDWMTPGVLSYTVKICCGGVRGNIDWQGSIYPNAQGPGQVTVSQVSGFKHVFLFLILYNLLKNNSCGQYLLVVVSEAILIGGGVKGNIDWWWCQRQYWLVVVSEAILIGGGVTGNIDWWWYQRQYWLVVVSEAILIGGGVTGNINWSWCRGNIYCWSPTNFQSNGKL